MKNKKMDMSEIIAWANKYIEKYRDEFERMHGYTSEIRRHDVLAKQIGEMRRNKSSNRVDLR